MIIDGIMKRKCVSHSANYSALSMLRGGYLVNDSCYIYEVSES